MKIIVIIILNIMYMFKKFSKYFFLNFNIKKSIIGIKNIITWKFIKLIKLKFKYIIKVIEKNNMS